MCALAYLTPLALPPRVMTSGTLRTPRTPSFTPVSRSDSRSALPSTLCVHMLLGPKAEPPKAHADSALPQLSGGRRV